MTKRISRPVALTIAGSDSGGGAGLQADLKTFAALGVHGTSVVTCITAQNPARVRGIQACTSRMVREQLDAVFSELPPSAMKTGMLLSAPLIRAVFDFIRHHARVPLVVDPVMIATSGGRLLEGNARPALEKLMSLAALVTPNLDEATRLTGMRIRTEEGMRRAARRLHERYGCAALVKGGHLPRSREAVDILFDGKEEFLLSAPFVTGVRTHGTGCTYSAAITANLARGEKLIAAVTSAKKFITGAITHGYYVSNHFALDPLWNQR